MKTTVDQFCINVTDLERSVHFYSEVLGLAVTHRIETPDFREVVLFWKLYLQSDDCKQLYDRCIAAGAESITPPTRLEHWPVTAAFVRDPDGYMVEILETHGESPAVSGPGPEKW
jgi:lactoylglutathione lyase